MLLVIMRDRYVANQQYFSWVQSKLKKTDRILIVDKADELEHIKDYPYILLMNDRSLRVCKCKRNKLIVDNKVLPNQWLQKKVVFNLEEEKREVVFS